MVAVDSVNCVQDCETFFTCVLTTSVWTWCGLTVKGVTHPEDTALLAGCKNPKN